MILNPKKGYDWREMTFFMCEVGSCQKKTGGSGTRWEEDGWHAAWQMALKQNDVQVAIFFPKISEIVLSEDLSEL
jgi:hypothetical protein